MMKTVALPDGETVPALGQGTWMMGERHDRRDAEIAALRAGVALGMTLSATSCSSSARRIRRTRRASGSGRRARLA
jgi:diketogulonate reductase-like aldo/keto reductase